VCMAERYPDLFPQAAVVFCSVSEQVFSRLPVTSRMTGVAYRLDYQGTLEIACRLFPKTHDVIIVSGFGEDDLAMLEQAKAAFPQEKKRQFTFWTGLPVADLCEEASRVEPGTIIIYLAQERDRDGRLLVTPREVAQRISECAHVPVFGLYDTLMGSGIVGGNLVPVESQGQRAGTVAARVIQGERPSDIPISGTEMNRPVFDWRQLRRWGIHERDLPVGSLVLFREPTVWQRYWAYITAAVVALGLQSLLIVTLLVNRRKRWHAEHALADQLQFETLLSDVSSRFVEIHPDDVHAEIERALACVVERLGLDHGAVFRLSEDRRHLCANVSTVRAGEAHPPAVIPLDSIPWMWAQLKRGEVFRFSSLSDLPAEASHERALAIQLGLKSAVAVALQDNGTVFGMLKFGLRAHEQAWDEKILQRLKLICEVVADALAHARADELLAATRSEARQLAGRLLTAQEDERKRLAREMHDDVSQRLAATAIQAGKMEQQLVATDPSRAALASIKEHLIDLSRDVHRMSRQLHPAILDDLGLPDAIRSECERLGNQSQLAIHFHCGHIPTRLPKDIALCLYRVAQESLWNAAKHAHTDRVDLALNADAEFVRLEVHDYGCGFNVAQTLSQPGLGLASMRERVRLVGGNINVESAPQQGASIVVSIPLPEDAS
jgi:signal transduction histidine kinase